jgi:hypothetical protein
VALIDLFAAKTLPPGCEFVLEKAATIGYIVMTIGSVMEYRLDEPD